MKLHKHNLILTSGIVWTLSGLMLIIIFLRWLNILTDKQILWAVIIGIPIGLIKGKLFWHISQKNINRILNLPHKTHILNFQTPTAYAFILFMMAFGITMRTTNIIAKKYLAPIYIGIGLALLISSFVYYITYLRLKRA